ncbi:MAG: MFS transporter, partial [Gammaproteobacteria bacterium]|nr:MFS transporter [Gammaproteobacteria bacterium]
GAYGAVGSLGAALFAPLAGWLIEHYSYRPLFVVVSLLPILSAVLLMLFVPRIRQLSAA